MSGELLTTKQIKALKEHKYSAQGSSLCEPVMQIFWKWLVEQIPRTWSPNMITLIGLLMNVVSSAVLMLYNPDGLHESPRWVYVMCASGLFIYQSLDAIDGKQARRTQSNTPLGELFDHGCDSLSTVFVMVGCCISLKLGQEPMVLLFEICASELCFYMAHWQTYVTGTLKFGMIDVTEGQFTVIFIYTICAISPGFFDNTLPVVGVPLRYLCALGSWLPSMYFIFKTSQLILQGGVGKNKSTVAVAHMTKSEMHLLDWSLLGPMMLFMNQYFNSKFNEYILLWIVFIYSLQNWLTYNYNVCREICAHLNIYCFNITEKPNGERKTSDKDK
ncbi:choline/ethanolaminephosphotransferase 1-like isoform X2 [Dreissena polymorpha]|uniref:choline/ethanolaminephosphotransferase 1-like isoform X2 n=1 Tax=Dreissena polymorpha TaxID=45954 RepID=UPI00226429CB|nr:choline/ethanolaminephosphotransferase 1-like isoform X2 [Dreissena polymorpha]